MKAALLPDRGVVKVAGDDARNFLHGLLSADILELAPAGHAFARCCRRRAKSSRISSSPKRRRRMAAAFFSTFRARWRNRWSTSSISTSCARASWSRICPKFSACWRLGRRGGDAGIGLSYADPRLPALGFAYHAAASRRRCRRGSRRRPRRSERIRSAPHCAWHPARRRRFRLWRRLPARGGHGSARRRRFRQRLLCRPGGRVAHGASRHRAHARRTGSL